MFKNSINKALIVMLFTSTCSTLLCWNNVIKNETDGQIVATVIYAGAGICSPITRIIDQGQEVTIDSGICCAERVTVRSTSGTLSGKEYTVNPPRAGINMTCAHFKVRVYEGVDGVLRAEAAIF